MKPNMLITGAAGFIGHFLVKEFCDDYNVICLVKPHGNTDRLKEFSSKIKIVTKDIATVDLNVDFIDEDIDVILHAAGNPSSASSFNNRIDVVHTNVLGTVNLLEYAKRKGVPRFVYYGAAESYGRLRDTAEPLGTPYDCYSPYAASKASGEEFCSAYSKSFGIKTSIIHIANTFGERCQKNRFPVVAMKQIMNNEPVHLVATDGHIGGRRWLHAHDVALHTRFILDNQQLEFEKWNSAGREYMSNLVFLVHLAKVMGKEFNYNIASVHPESHTAQLMFNNIDPDKLYFCGYKEKFTIGERLQQTYDWYTMNPSWL
jgi:nucleoside-diphosphate-sugar epimerase